MGLLPYFFPLFDILQRSRAEESVLLKKSFETVVRCAARHTVINGTVSRICCGSARMMSLKVLQVRLSLHASTTQFPGLSDDD